MAVKTYKKKAISKLSTNFKSTEFDCHGSGCCSETLIDEQLVEYLQDIRDHFGKPVTVSSAYRCATHNKNVGGATGSRHMKGQAADIDIQGDMVFGRKIFEYIRDHLPFDQLIWEHSKSGTYWVHVSFVYPDFGKNRRQVINNLEKK